MRMDDDQLHLALNITDAMCSVTQENLPVLFYLKWNIGESIISIEVEMKLNN